MEFIRELQTGVISSAVNLRYTAPQGIAGYQSIIVDLKDTAVEDIAVRVLDKTIAKARSDAFEVAYHEHDYNKLQDDATKLQNDAERKMTWIAKSANAVAEAREREREKAIEQIVKLISGYFSNNNIYHSEGRDKIKNDLTDLIRNFVEEPDMVTLEEIEKMTGH
jgi:hypothetical protein